MVKLRFPDRLSRLPDHVLHYLFSFLDFCDVVRTCVLSKRWRHLWCTSPYLNFDMIHMEEQLGHYNFWSFTNYALLLRDASSRIKRLSLHFEDLHPIDQLPLLLRVASKYRVQELFISDIDGSYHDTGYTLHLQRPLCESLTVLRLHFFYTIRLEADACLTSLKSLYLRRVQVSGHAVKKIFSSDCIELESVHLDDIVVATETEDVEICAPNLKHLCIVNVQEDEYRMCLFNLKSRLTISSPNLLSFTYIGALLPDFDLRNAVSLVNGVIRVLEDKQLPSPAMFSGVYHARVLTLNTVVVKYFSPGYGESLCNVVKFNNLNCLKLEIRCNDAHIEGLINLLNLSPNLESLFIIIQEGKRYCFEDYSRPWFPTKVIHRGRPWKSREEYIPCMAHVMSFIQVSFFDGSRIALELIKFLLRNGKVLRKLEILHWNKERKESSCQKVLSFPKASSEILLSFPEDYDLHKLPHFDLGESDDDSTD